MHLSIKGIKGERRKCIKAAAEWLVDRLIHPRSARNLYIDIQFANLNKTNSLGYCQWLDNNIRPKDFEILIHDGLGKKDTLLTLCHELFHVKQYVKHDLAELYRPSHRFYWKGEYLPKTISYNDMPWEREAFDNQFLLYEELKISKVCRSFKWNKH